MFRATDSAGTQKQDMKMTQFFADVWVKKQNWPKYVSDRIHKYSSKHKLECPTLRYKHEPRTPRRQGSMLLWIGCRHLPVTQGHTPQNEILISTQLKPQNLHLIPQSVDTILSKRLCKPTLILSQNIYIYQGVFLGMQKRHVLTSQRLLHLYKKFHKLWATL